MNIVQLQALLARITFNGSCVDMGWKWEVEEVFVEGPGNYGFRKAGFRIRTTFQRPDTDDPSKIERGFGRWWEVPLDASKSAVVKTAFKACLLILEHELMEAFLVDGDRPFDPHNDVDDLRTASRLHRIPEKVAKESALEEARAGFDRLTELSEAEFDRLSRVTRGHR